MRQKKVEKEEIDQTVQIHNQFQKRWVTVSTKVGECRQRIESLEKIILGLETKKEELIPLVQQENLKMAKKQLISSGYDNYYELICDYQNERPKALLSDLGATVVDLYNSFNQNDPEYELLNEIKLPLQVEDRIYIAFRNKPDEFVDALHFLSEGHIRCIGLSILLAKNIKENCPILIFDDAINAIDDEHRSAIRETLFGEHSLFKDKQIILTCHGEEFIKDVQNMFTSSNVRQTANITFLRSSARGQIRVRSNSSPKHYVAKAREHINNGENRDALSNARRALENLIQTKLWKLLEKHGDSRLSISLRSYNSKPELRNLTEVMRKKISKSFPQEKKEQLVSILDAILGSGSSVEWTYLNKGTHEESNRIEFDQVAVEKIVGNLEALEQALTQDQVQKR